jgi:hypothetical protein
MKILNTLYADIFYDNTNSGLSATTLKNAIDEISGVANIQLVAATLDLDNDNFIGLLSAADNNAQSAFDILDAVDAEAIPYDNSTSNLIANSVKQAIDALHQLFFSALRVFDGGSPDTNTYVYALDGGSPDDGATVLSVDGGNTLGQTIDGGDAIND